MSDRMAIAEEFWDEIPDWLGALIDACDQPGASQVKVAQRLGRSSGVISEVLRNRYKGDMADFEERVRSVYCASEVTCPALGTITSEDCLMWRDQASDLKTGPMFVRMYRACNDCPRFAPTQEEADNG